MKNNETIVLENVYMTDENRRLRPFTYTVIAKIHLPLKERIKGFIRWLKFKLFTSRKYKFTAEITKVREKNRKGVKE